MKEDKLYFENHGQKIVGFLTPPFLKTDSVILLAHGFTGNMNGPADLYKRLAYKLTENGFAVYRFNFRFTTGKFENFQNMTVSEEVDDLKLLINEFSKKYKKVGVVGESLGGAISILAYSTKVKCLVLYYPAIFFKENIGNRFSSDEEIRLMHKEGRAPWVKRSTGQKFFVGKDFIQEVKRIEIFPKIPKIKCPILFVTGNSDTSVSHTESERAFKVASEPKKIEIIEGAEHGFKKPGHVASIPLQDKAINVTVEWFNKWLK